MTGFALEGIVIELSWLGLCWLSPLSEQSELYFFALHFFTLPEQCFFPYLRLYQWNTAYVMSKVCWEQVVSV